MEIELEEDIQIEEKQDIPVYVMAIFIALSGLGFLFFTVYYIAFLPVPVAMQPLRIRILTALQLESVLEDAKANMVVIVSQEEEYGVNIYSNPDETVEVITVGLIGDTFKRLEEDGDWSKLDAGAGRIGWVKSVFVMPVE